MTCTVLSDSTVREILLNLPKEKIITFLEEIEKALISFSNAEEKALQPSPSVVKRSDGRKTLFRPFSSDAGPGVKIIVDPTTTASDQAQRETPAKKPTLHGILALCDRDGIPIGLVNAEEITAFRTAMSVMVPWRWRENTEHVVVFGAGKVALWHVRLVLRLRGAEVKRITVVNRSMERSVALVEQVQKEDTGRFGFAGELIVLETEKDDYEEKLEASLSKADVVLCTTPSKTVLFRPEALGLDTPGRRDPFVSAIGSWTADMIEVDSSIFSYAVSSESGNGKSSRGVVIADDREGVLKHSGEIVESKLQAEEIMELGEILGQRSEKSDAFSELSSRYLNHGLILYKSIGVSMTDLVSGQVLLEFARERNMGVSLTDF